MPHNPDQHRADLLFAASIHELKNRFGLLLVNLEALLPQLTLAPEQQGAVASIRHDAQYIGDELVRLLTVFKAAGGQLRANIDQYALEDLLEEVVARHATTARATGCMIGFECDSELVGFLDEGIIRVVLDTCIYNAVKAGAHQITLRAVESQDGLRIDVDDDGPGFPEEMRLRYNASIDCGSLAPARSVNPAENTTGLGLYFANSLLAQICEQEACGRLLLGVSPEGGAQASLLIPQ
ncbi:Sensor histidine kinase [gamma proteobacterium HdN1]|nr:Sensor histidine kinase [gamma proteobacterium HdN1]